MKMFYRILQAPPGYPPDQQYLVAAYETTDYASSKYWLTKDDGSKFMATLEEARRLIPSHAKRLPSQPDHQFLELWEE
jgi:hypothetical protein